MTKGKPWTVDEELRLKELFDSGASVSKIAVELSKTEDAVGHKLKRLGLKVGQTPGKIVPSSFTEVELPEDVPTIEEALKTLAGVMVKLRGRDLNRDELKRLRLLADVVEKYKIVYTDYVDRRRLEKKIEALEKKLEGRERNYRKLLDKTAKV